VPECSRWLRALVILTVLTGSPGCSSAPDELLQHQRKIHSLKSTAALIGRSWTAGHVTSTFARTGLEHTFRLVEEERAALVRSAGHGSRPSFSMAIEDAEAASRTIAALEAAVQSGDRGAVQRHVSELSTQARKHA